MEKERIRPQLTISLLVSNRPDSVRKCLDSLRPIMEKIPSELILVDTSKNPQIHEILLEYTDKVYNFEWCNNFAKARNIGLKNATGEWFLFLDDDEWFVEIDELLQFFASGEYKQYGYANYQVRNFFEPSYTYFSDSWVSRMIRIDADTTFRGRIHEYMYPVRGKCKNIDALAYHSGYIFVTDEQKKAHFERNATLLYEMIQEEPDNFRWKAQLAQEYRTVKAWQELCDFCEQCIESTLHINDSYDNIQIGAFYAGYVEGALFLKNYASALQMCERALKDKRNTELCAAYMHLSLGVVYLNMGDYDKARAYIEEYFREAETLPQKEEVMLLQTMAPYVNEAFDDTNIKKAYSVLISCGIKQGSIEELKNYYDKLELNQSVIYVYDGTEKYFVEAMATMEYDPIFARVATDGFHNSELRELLMEEARRWEQSNWRSFQNVMYAFAQAEADDWYIWYARLRTAGFVKDAAGFDQAMEGFYRTFMNVLAIPKEIRDIAEELSIDIYQKWKDIEADKWKSHVRQYIKSVGEEQLQGVCQKVDEVFAAEDWRYQFFQLALLEGEVTKGPREPWNLMSYYETLEKLVMLSLEFYGRYYREEAFLQYGQMLPETLQATMKIMEFLELQEQDTKRALESLKESILLCPEWATGIRRFLIQYPELEQQKARRQKEELNLLRAQVMAQVENMLTKGQAMEALAIVAQLKQMVPKDMDVLELELRARLQSLEE